MTDNERERFITQLLDSVGTLVPSLDQPVFDDKRRVLKNAFFFPDNCSGALSDDLKNALKYRSVRTNKNNFMEREIRGKCGFGV